MGNAEQHEVRVMLVAESAMSSALTNEHLLWLCALMGVDIEDVKKYQVFGRRFDQYPEYITKDVIAASLRDHVVEEQ